MKYVKALSRIVLLCVAIVIALAAIFPDWVDSVSAVFRDRSEWKRMEAADAEYSHAQKYPIAEDRQISISGAISETPFDLNITYTVLYTAREDKAGCYSHNLFIGKDPLAKFHSYRAKIANHAYSIDLPLNEYPAYEGCHFQPSTVSIGISRAGEKASRTDDLFGDEKHYRSLIEMGYSTSPVDDNRMAIECRQPAINGKMYANSWDCRHDLGNNNLQPLIQRLDPSGHNREWNIDIKFIPEADAIQEALRAKNQATAREDVVHLVRLVNAYDMVIRNPVRRQTVAELLSVIQGKMDMSDYRGSPFIDTYNEQLAEIRRDIPNQNGIPVDPWGRPYQCTVRKTRPDREPRPELYSLGADGIESDDDIGGWAL